LNLAKENYDMRNLGYRNDIDIIMVPGQFHYFPRLISLLPQANIITISLLYQADFITISLLPQANIITISLNP
jgi:hypothetical protein